MTDASVRLQYNYKLPSGDLFNIYAIDEDEASELLEAAGRLAGKAAEIAQLLRATGGAAATLSTAPQGVDPVPSSYGASFPTFPAQRPAPVQEGFGGAPQCPHGPMIHKASAAGAAKKWSAYFCGGPKAEQCKPIDAKTGKPWG